MSLLRTIRFRLNAALALIVGLSAILSAISLLTMGQANTAVKDLGAQSLPKTSEAAMLALNVKEAVVEIGALGAAKTVDEVEASAQRLDNVLNEISANLSRLGDFAAITSTDEIAAVADKLRSDAPKVRAAVEARLATSAAIEDEMLAAQAFRGQIAEELELAIDTADDAVIETILRIGMEANLITTLYAEASKAPDATQIEVIRALFEDSLEELQINLAILGAGASNTLTTKVAAFAAIGEDEANIFAMRTAQLDALAQSSAIEIAAIDTSHAIDTEIAALRSQVERNASAVAGEAASSLGNARIVMGVGAGVLVALAGLIGWVVVDRGLVRALQRLTGAMRRLAEGDTETPAPDAERDDEIGQMAQSVEVFRENAKRVEALNAEKEQAEAERGQARERTEAERRAMMERLQNEFGVVVEAALAGDFSKRAPTSFDDAELNELARGLNDLATTVDRGLGETCQVLAAMADMDLSRRVTGAYRGAFANLKDSVNATCEQLTGVVAGMQGAASGLRGSMDDLLTGAEDLADRTTKQAATLEQTAAATEELARTVKDNASRADQARANADNAHSIANDGGDVMRQSTDAINRIAASSAKISDIIGLIDNIAFQTNLLALNASVEAARAGEAGKGFAVVAAEVRRLAQSAGEASAEVKTLIDAGADEVREGVDLVAKAAQSLEAIVASVGDVTTLMSAIANDSREQAGALDEVNVAVRNLDDMTQHNAAMVEQSNAAIAQAQQRVAEIDHTAASFTINAEPAAASAERPSTSSLAA